MNIPRLYGFYLNWFWIHLPLWMHILSYLAMNEDVLCHDWKQPIFARCSWISAMRSWDPGGLPVLSREWRNGMIIHGESGSFPHSLPSTSRVLTKQRKEWGNGTIARQPHGARASTPQSTIHLTPSGETLRRPRYSVCSQSGCDFMYIPVDTHTHILMIM